MRLTTILIAIAAALSLSGCSTFLMKDCEQQGNSQYFHCKQPRVIF